ncbi:MAG: DUF3419 family protein [Proteobacteria bacterium]|nr:DUF3419 family protein [Pseudomonadota bacterium]
MVRQKIYFQQLNYTLANEDSRLERQLVKLEGARAVLSVCGSGGRSLPLAVSGLTSLTCCDLSQEQLYLAQLRLASIRSFDFDSFCLFWGFPPFHVEENTAVRRELLTRLPLEPKLRDYAQALFEQNRWQGLLYTGHWEKTFTIAPRLLRRFIGSIYDTMFKFQSLEDQQQYIQKKLDSALWKSIPQLVLLIFGNRAYFNAFLYKGDCIKKNIPVGYFHFYRMAFRRMFALGLARENFFLQLAFLGELRYPEGNPVEAQAEFYAEMQTSLKSIEPNFEALSIFDYAQRTKQTYDFVSLSDVPSYLQGPLEQDYLQCLRPCLKPKALVVSRCYLRVPEHVNFQNFKDVTHEFQELIDQEKTQMYQIMIHRYEGTPE